MESTSTRLEITPALNELLNNKLEELKSQGVKGLNKKILLEKLCKAGLEYQMNGNQTAASKGNTDEMGILYPPGASSSVHVLETKGELIAIKEALKKKEIELRDWEKHLDQKEKEIYVKHQHLLTEKEGNYNQSIDKIKESLNNKHNERQLKDREEEVNKLKDENRKLNKDLFKLRIKFDSKPEKDVFWDIIVPLSSPALVAYLIFQQTIGIQPGSKFHPEILQFINALKMLPETEQVKMVKEIIDVINKYTGKGQRKQEQKTGDVS